MNTTVHKRRETKGNESPYVSTTNACKLCAPLGAALAFRGIEGAVPFLHGSQGCATYMRRYLISHFREPVDIASSSLGEKNAIYGGGPNLKQGIKNVIQKYHPQLIGIATTCLTETIGDDAPMIVNEFRREEAAALNATADIQLITVSTPSYSGTHVDGFHSAVRETVKQLTGISGSTGKVNVFPGLLSPADIRYLKEALDDFGLQGIVLPDISETLDGPAQEDYEKVPEGGTPIADIRNMGGSIASLEFGTTLADEDTAGRFLEERFQTPLYSLGTPIGLRESDLLFEALAEVAGKEIPRKHALERGRLIDAYVDGHKYIFGKRAIVYGEEDLVIGITAFLAEIGVRPVLCASGGKSGKMKEAIGQLTSSFWPLPPPCGKAPTSTRSRNWPRGSSRIFSSATARLIACPENATSRWCGSASLFMTALAARESCTSGIAARNIFTISSSTRFWNRIRKHSPIGYGYQ